MSAADPDLIVAGVLAVRRFRVDEEGRLRPPVFAYEGFVWEPGVNTAVCITYGHPTPSPDCTCGLYALNGTRGLPGGDLTGVVELSGLVEAGSMGYRAERGRVVALARRPGQVTRELVPAGSVVLCALAMASVTGALVGSSALVIVAYDVAWLCLLAVVAMSGYRHKRRSFARVQRLYPEVACYRSQKAMLRAHPLTAAPEQRAAPGEESWRSDLRARRIRTRG